MGNLLNIMLVMNFERRNRGNEEFQIPYILYSKNLISYPVIEIILMIPRTVNRILEINNHKIFETIIIQTFFDSIQGFLFSAVCVMNNMAFRRDFYRWCHRKKKFDTQFLNPELDFNNTFETFFFRNEEKIKENNTLT